MKDFFAKIGIDISFTLMAFISAVVVVNQETNKRKTKFQRLVIFLSGLVFAIYVSPLIVWVVKISGYVMPFNAQLGLCYLCGVHGTNIVDMIMRIDWERVKKLTELFGSIRKK